LKPLLTKDLDTFLNRFGNFVDGEIRSLEMTSPSNMTLTIAAQDSARGFDWLTIIFNFDGVSDASLVNNNKLGFIDLSDGISLTHDSSNFKFKINNATLYINSLTIKYQEGSF